MEDDTIINISETEEEILIDFGDICRFCLNKTDSAISIHDRCFLDENKDGGETIYDFVMNFSSIEMESPNGFPTLVCKNCWEVIQICYEFRSSCRQSDASLRECYSKTLEQTKAQYFNKVSERIEEKKVEVKSVHEDSIQDGMILDSMETVTEETHKTKTNTLSDRLKYAQMKLREDLMRSQYFIMNFSNTDEKMSGKCLICSARFTTVEGLKSHVMQSHNKKNVFQCQLCSVGFLEGYKLTLHYLKVHKRNPGNQGDESIRQFFCYYCDPIKGFTRKDSAVRHLKSSHNRNDEEIKSDIGNIDVQNYACNYCSSRFSARFSLNRHLVRVHKLAKEQIKDSDLKLLKLNEEEQEEEKKVEKDEKSNLCKVYICTDCYPPNSFQDINIYIEHKKKAHDKDLENISVKELSAVYVQSVNVFDQDVKKATIICKNCDPPEKFVNTRDYIHHMNELHQDSQWENGPEIVGSAGALCTAELEDSKSDVKKRWDCPDCSLSYCRRNSLHKHLRQKHGINVKLGYIQCPECDERFPTNRQVIQHGITVHQKYYADLHDQYKEKILLKIPSATKREKKYQCDTCQRRFFKKEALKAHIVKDHLNGDSNESVVCTYCGKVVSNKQNLKSHIEYVHEAVFVSCPICERKVNFKSIGKHYRTHQPEDQKIGKTDFLCNLCGKILKSKTSFEDHQKIHKNIRDHICDVCGEGFTNKKCLYIHKKTHDGPLRRVFKCENCDKTFNGRQSLKRHMLTHTGTKDFICEFCSKCFYTIQELKRHLRYHKKEYRFNCQLCEMRFFDKSRFRTHMMRHRNVRPHKCQFCDKLFIVRRKMNLHMAARHNYVVQDTKGIWKDPKTYIPLDKLL